MNVNKYIATGRLTKDPELRSVPSATSVCELRSRSTAWAAALRAAHQRQCLRQAGRGSRRDLSKGWLVAVDGRLEFAEWDTDTGERRHDYTVVGNVEFLAAPRVAEEEPQEPEPSRRRRTPLAA